MHVEILSAVASQNASLVHHPFTDGANETTRAWQGGVDVGARVKFTSGVQRTKFYRPPNAPYKWPEHYVLVKEAAISPSKGKPRVPSQEMVWGHHWASGGDLLALG